MASDRHIFDRSGPEYLSHVDWSNADHRRAVAASLVQGAYILERDRQGYRLGRYALATPWWESFNFKLIEEIVDEKDRSIIGAIYQYKLFSQENNSEKGAPQFVIAFRGFINNCATNDSHVIWELIKNGLKDNARFKAAMNVFEHFVSTKAQDGSNLWLTGHSLGSSMAIKAARIMVKKGIFIETHLFNPPFPPRPSNIIKNHTAKLSVRVFVSLVRAILATFIKLGNNSSEESFILLLDWIPNLYVHPNDIICSGYIDYFQHRRFMEEMGPVAGYIENIATRHSLYKLIKKWIGMDHDVLYLIPSAILNVNISPATAFREDHGIHQWWSPYIDLDSTGYKFGE